MVGNLAVTEGDNLNLKCAHQSGFPASNRSLFFLNGTTTYGQEVNKFLRWYWGVIGSMKHIFCHFLVINVLVFSLSLISNARYHSHCTVNIFTYTTTIFYALK